MELLEEVALIIAIDTFPPSGFVAEGTCTTSGAVQLQICEVLAQLLILTTRSTVACNTPQAGQRDGYPAAASSAELARSPEAATAPAAQGVHEVETSPSE